jgi:hypothetical protein
MIKSLLLSLTLAVAFSGCGKPAADNSAEASLDELSRAFSVMSMKQGGRSIRLADLTNFPGLQGKHLPQPPKGKKLAIDRAAQRVVIVDE